MKLLGFFFFLQICFYLQIWVFLENLAKEGRLEFYFVIVL